MSIYVAESIVRIYSSSSTHQLLQRSNDPLQYLLYVTITYILYIF